MDFVTWVSCATKNQFIPPKSKKQSALCCFMWRKFPLNTVVSLLFTGYLSSQHSWWVYKKKKSHQECAKSRKWEAKTQLVGCLPIVYTAIEGSFTLTWFKIMYCVHFKPLNKISVSRKTNRSSTRLQKPADNFQPLKATRPTLIAQWRVLTAFQKPSPNTNFTQP